MKRVLVLLILLCIAAGSFFIVRRTLNPLPEYVPDSAYYGKVISGRFDTSKYRPDPEWRTMLTAKQYKILREKGTEVPFSGELNKEDRPGTYYSVGCDTPVFRSETKFDSRTGWPSFWAPIGEDSLVLQKDGDRIEVLDVCGGHLGHVFDDGPKPSGKRFCINSESLYFMPD